MKIAQLLSKVLRELLNIQKEAKICQTVKLPDYKINEHIVGHFPRSADPRKCAGNSDEQAFTILKQLKLVYEGLKTDLMSRVKNEHEPW